MPYRIAVVGLGKLGLPLACLHAQYHRVFGVDQNREAVKLINDKCSPIVEPLLPDLLAKVVGNGTFTAHTDYSVVTDTDMSMVIVPTPSNPEGAFSSGHVVEAVREIGKAIRNQQKRHIVVVCSTVMPGECDGIIRATLERESEKAVGEDVGLIYSPEFIALGSVIDNMMFPSLTLVGESDPESGRVYEKIANSVVSGKTSPTRHMTLTSAEIAKIALNSYVTTKISFANSLGEICEKYPNADAEDVAGAIGLDPRVGSKYIHPGGPYGGPCFPRDNRAFSVVGDRVGVVLPIAKAADEVNDRQIDRMARIIQGYGRRIVGIVGMAYKMGTPVCEESFGAKLGQEMQRRGFQVQAYSAAEIPNRSKVLDLPANWSRDMANCFGNDTVTVICLPDPEVAKRLSEILASENRRHSIVIDVWNTIPEGPWDATHILRPGKSPDAY